MIFVLFRDSETLLTMNILKNDSSSLSKLDNRRMDKNKFFGVIKLIGRICNKKTSFRNIKIFHLTICFTHELFVFRLSRQNSQL